MTPPPNIEVVKESSHPSVECELAGNLPMLPDEMKLLQDLLPELLKDMRWLQADEE